MPHEWEEIQTNYMKFSGTHGTTFEWECRNCHVIHTPEDPDEEPPSPYYFVGGMTCEEIIASQIHEC